MTPPKRTPRRPKTKPKARPKPEVPPVVVSMTEEALGKPSPKTQRQQRIDSNVARLFPESEASAGSILEILCDFMDTAEKTDPGFAKAMKAATQLPLGEAKLLAGKSWWPKVEKQISPDDRLTALALGFILLLSGTHCKRLEVLNAIFSPTRNRTRQIRKLLADLLLGPDKSEKYMNVLGEGYPENP